MPGVIDVLSNVMVIGQSRWKTALRLGLCLASLLFAALVASLSWGMKSAPAEAPVLSTVIFLLAGAGALVCLAQLVRPGRLEISPQGLAEHGLFRTRRWPWEAFARFSVLTYRGARRVVFHLARPEAQPALRRWMARLAGYDGSLMSGWSEPPRRLVPLLNETLQRWRPRR